MTITQQNREMSVTTPLGDDVLLLTAFTGQEGISRLFHFELEFLSENTGIAAKDIIGKSITWVIQSEGGPRYFNGNVSRFTAGPMRSQGQRSYRAEVVPWLWLLTRTADCRIFQNKTAPDIIEQLFKEYGFTAYQKNLTATYVQREYCVQYRETDFAFISRLMEQEGIFYFFQHDNNKHTLVWADAKSAYQDCAENQVTYTAGELVPNHVDRWDHGYEFRSGKYTQTDYNFETPATDLQSQTTTIMPVTDTQKYEVYDYPGLYAKKADGTAWTKVRMEEEETAFEVVHGAGSCRTFSPGCKFTMQTHECSSEAGKGYVITGIEHSAADESYVAGDGQAQPYRNTFTCIPDSTTFRPPRVTPRPTIKGPQTAVVVGPSGEEIYTDKYGRVKVQFYWDREGSKDENSSCWIRVAESWAGKNWGIVFNPRIGQEVVIDFLEGDPDRPLITGRVYNAQQMPPYTLPDNQTQSVIKSRSSKDGTTDNFNELRFEDKKDSELIFFHAEKDFQREVENNDTLKVGFDKKDKGDQTITIFNNRSLTVGCKDADDGSQTTTIFNDDKLTVGCSDAKEVSQTISIYKDRTTSLETGNETLTVKQGNRSVTIQQGNESLTVSQGTRTVTVQGDDTHEVKQGNRTVKIDMGNDNLTVTQGNLQVNVSAGKISMSGMQAIELTCGASSIKLEPAKITLQAPVINVQAQAQAQVQGAMVQLQANAMLQAQGGIIQIG